jgi:hypothetical protein
VAKRIILAIVAVFVAWSAVDFVIHGIVLAYSYQETHGLWRPMNEMKMGILHLTVLISAIVFVLMYARFVSEKGIGVGILYGLLFGIASGVPMGFGTYSVMPIPLFMAVVWCCGTIVEFILGGIIASLIVKK